MSEEEKKAAITIAQFFANQPVLTDIQNAASEINICFHMPHNPQNVEALQFSIRRMAGALNTLLNFAQESMEQKKREAKND